jgi:hypothetical protein
MLEACSSVWTIREPAQDARFAGFSRWMLQEVTRALVTAGLRLCAHIPHQKREKSY